MFADGGALHSLIGTKAVAVVAIVAMAAMSACNENDDTTQQLEETTVQLEETQKALDDALAKLEKTERKLRRALKEVEEAAAPDLEPGELPDPLTAIEHGGTYWGVYWVGRASDPEITGVASDLEARGYISSSGDIACDEGASEALGVRDNAYRVALYFEEEEEARAFEQNIDIEPAPFGVAEVQTFCLD